MIELNLPIDERNSKDLSNLQLWPIKPRSYPEYKYSEAEIIWTFPISIWAKSNWVKDESEVSNKAFDHDWELARERMPKAIKDDENELNNIKDLIRTNYSLFRYLYKYWAS